MVPTISGIKLSMDQIWYDYRAPNIYPTAMQPLSAVSATIPNLLSSSIISFRLASESYRKEQAIIRKADSYSCDGNVVFDT